MLTEERYRAILDLLNQKQAVTVAELTEALSASESTIRRDLTALHRQGRLLKVHGGATALSSYLSYDSDMQTKNDLNLEEKQRIAEYAAGMVGNGDVIFLDAGSTTRLVISYLQPSDALFVTNGLEHACALSRAGFSVVMLGGEVKPVTEAVVGPSVVDTIRQFNFTKGFFGVNGISPKAGYTTPEWLESAVKSEAMRRCRNCYVLADSGKFEAVATMSFAPLSDATIITTSAPHSVYFKQTNIIEVK